MQNSKTDGKNLLTKLNCPNTTAYVKYTFVLHEMCSNRIKKNIPKKVKISQWSSIWEIDI